LQPDLIELTPVRQMERKILRLLVGDQVGCLVDDLTFRQACLEYGLPDAHQLVKFVDSGRSQYQGCGVSGVVAPLCEVLVGILPEPLQSGRLLGHESRLRRRYQFHESGL
jgi:hypothetical protein